MLLQADSLAVSEKCCTFASKAIDYIQKEYKVY